MSLAVGVAVASILVPLGCVGWNMGRPKSAMKPWMERLATSAGTGLGATAVVLAESTVALVLGVVGLVLSSALLALTFLSRLPAQRPAVAVGEAAPDFELQDSEGRTWRLSEHAGSWIVLKFYRGYWCPYCVRDLHDWEKLLGELAARGAKLVAISPDRRDELLEFGRQTGFKMALLADPENRVINQYNLQNLNFTPRRGPFRELVIPTTILVDDRGIVRWLDQASDFRIRRPAHEIMAQIDVFLPARAAQVCTACADESVIAR